MKKIAHFFFVLGMLVLTIFADQFSKAWFTHHFALHESKVLVEGFALTLVHNHGAAFSLLNEGHLWQKGFLTLISLCVTFVLLYLILKPTMPRQERMAYFFVCAGAIGNLIDRIRFGYVIDFIDWYYRDWHWPVFNLADSYICFGAFLLMLAWLQEWWREK